MVSRRCTGGRSAPPGRPEALAVGKNPVSRTRAVAAGGLPVKVKSSTGSAYSSARGLLSPNRWIPRDFNVTQPGVAARFGCGLQRCILVL